MTVTAIALGLLLIAGFAIGYTPDTDPAAMRAKYGGPPSRFVALGGGLTVHVRDTGPRDSPVLLLIHGSNADLHTWDRWTQLFERRMRVVRLDLPGHGLTGPDPTGDYRTARYVAVVDRLVRKLGLRRVALAGNSMGGGVAWHYALAHPDRLRALILIDSVGQPEPAGSKPPLGFRIARWPVVRDLATVITPRALIADSLPGVFHDPKLATDAQIDRYWELLRYPGNRRATIARFAAPRDPATTARLAAIRTPTLILWGADDRLIPASAGKWLAARISGSRLIVYPATGHLPMEEAADRSAADTAAFLGGIG